MARRRIHRGTRSRFRSFACVAVLGLLCAAPVRSQGPDSQQPSLYALLTRGYAAISQHPAEAILIFEGIVRSYPESVVPRRQLGWLYIEAGRTEDALRQFSIADSLFPSDTTKLQTAYLLASHDRLSRVWKILPTRASVSDPLPPRRRSAGRQRRTRTRGGAASAAIRTTTAGSTTGSSGSG